jgi:hypothetical protein
MSEPAENLLKRTRQMLEEAEAEAEAPTSAEDVCTHQESPASLGDVTAAPAAVALAAEISTASSSSSGGHMTAPGDPAHALLPMSVPSQTRLDETALQQKIDEEDQLDMALLGDNDINIMKYPRRKIDEGVLVKFAQHTPVTLYQFLVDDVLNYVTQCTNEGIKTRQQPTKAHKIVSVKYAEMFMYQGLRLTMSLMRLPNEDYYWYPRSLGNLGIVLPNFKNYMKYYRYREIKSMMQFDKSHPESAESDPHKEVSVYRMDTVIKLMNDSLGFVGEDCNCVGVKGSTRRGAMTCYDDLMDLAIGHASNIYRQIHEGFDHLRFCSALAGAILNHKIHHLPPGR